MKPIYLCLLLWGQATIAAMGSLNAKVELSYPAPKKFDVRLTKTNLNYSSGSTKKKWKLNDCRFAQAYIFWKTDLEPQQRSHKKLALPSSFRQRLSSYDAKATFNGKTRYYSVNSINALRFYEVENRLQNLERRFQRYCGGNKK